MGRKYSQARGKSFVELNRKMNAERDASSERIKKQWDDPKKYVPVYELNNSADEDKDEQVEISQSVKTGKRRQTWNAGENSKGILLSDIQKEVSKLATKEDRKRFQRGQGYGGTKQAQSTSINGADVLGEPVSKRLCVESPSKSNCVSQESTTITNGSPLNKTKALVVSKKLDLVVDNNQSSNLVEVEENNYFVTTPSEEEESENEEAGYFSAFITNEYDGDSGDSFGIDLDEERDVTDEEEGEDSLNESDVDFVNDDLEEDEEVSSDELDRAEEILEKKRQKRVRTDSTVSMEELNDLLVDAADSATLKQQQFSLMPITNIDEDYDSNSDESFGVESGETLGDEDESEDESESEGKDDESGSAVSENEIDDLLNDFTGADGDFIMNESDEERIINLDPAGLDLKPVGLSIDGYDVDESTPKFLRIQKEKRGRKDSPVYKLFCFSSNDEHSVYTAIKAFKWIVSPIGIQEFFENIYYKRGMIIRRHDPDYSANVFPVSSFYKMFNENFLEYGVNINVAKYENGIRTTHNPEGRVYSGAIRSFVDQGMSIQCVNPQSFDSNIHYLCDVLQEMFNCFVGANCYYTPKGSAGFAPHYDDIDAFMVQTEGRKHWTIYAPSDEESWPLESSGNFTPEEMEKREGNLVFDGWLKAGDVLYLPRGFIHCAKTDSKHDSLHITISVAQHHTYSNLLERVSNKLLVAKTAEITQLRRNLPVDLLDICGVANSSYENDACFQKCLEKPLSLYLEQFQISLVQAISPAVDEIGRDFMRKSLPPLLTDYEKDHSIHRMGSPLFTGSTRVRLLRKHTQRLLFETEENAFLIHRMENSMTYEGRPETIVDVPTKLIAGIERLSKAYPNWESIENIGMKLKRNVEVAQFLFNRGLLLICEEGEPTTSFKEPATSFKEPTTKKLKKRKRDL